MNPNDRTSSSNDPNSSRREQDPQGTDPLRSAPGTDPAWNRPTQNPDTRPSGQADGAEDDEDMDEGESDTRQAGTMNPGSRRETPDDAMRRDREQRAPEQGTGNQQNRTDRNPDDHGGK
jgi:hypothetical protein